MHVLEYATGVSDTRAQRKRTLGLEDRTVWCGWGLGRASEGGEEDAGLIALGDVLDGVGEMDVVEDGLEGVVRVEWPRCGRVDQDGSKERVSRDNAMVKGEIAQWQGRTSCTCFGRRSRRRFAPA